MKRAAAQRVWFALAPDGTEHEVVLSVSFPVQQPSGEWGVDVSLGALEPRQHTIYGVDSWQALQLGMTFIGQRVGHFAEDGWKFFWERGGDAASTAELAPGV